MASLSRRHGRPQCGGGGKRHEILLRNSERIHGKPGFTDAKLAIIAERIFVQVFEKAKLCDSLSIRRSRVRALVGEPSNQEHSPRGSGGLWGMFWGIFRHFHK